MHTTLRGSRIAITILAALASSSCGGGSGTPPPPPAATHFSVVAQGGVNVGSTLQIKVTALDASNNIVTTYAGTVRLTSSDAQATLPSASTLPGGTKTFSATLATPGAQTVTATDTASASITGISNTITVSDAATHFSLTVPSNSTQGIAFNMTVTALDAANNVFIGYTGTVHFTSSDAQASLPANTTLANGAATVAATLNTLGGQTVTATDTTTASTAGTSSTITVGTSTPTHFSIEAPARVHPGIAFSFTVSALDAANNVAPTYAGTVHFTSSDAQASLPADSTLTNGTGTFSATLNTARTQTITATDTVHASITGTSTSILLLEIISGPPPNGTVGVGYGTLNNCAQPARQGFELAWTEGNGRYTQWSGSNLPPGLMIGEFSCPGLPPGGPYPVWLLYGAPTQAGTFSNVVIKVVDIWGTASATYTITINAASAAKSPGASTGPQRQHHHYKLVDMGTLGGPNSGLQENFLDFAGGAAVQVLSNQGTAIGNADTSMPDPLCYFDDCFSPHAQEWRDGRVADLGTIPGGQTSGTYWISGNGLIAGASENGQTDPLWGFPETHAVLWRNGAITDLGTLGGGYESWGLSVNDNGDVVGFSQNLIPDPNAPMCIPGITCTQTRAFLWHNGAMHDLGTLGGSDAVASLVNHRREVAGVSYTGTDPSTNCGVLFNSVLTTHPFFWDKNKGMVDIGTLGGTCAQPNAINNRGLVVGDSNLAGDATVHGFIWDHGVLTDVGTLGGSYSAAVWINDAGDVIGYAATSGDQYSHPYLRRHGVMIDLGTLPGENCGNVWGINASEQIVGGSLDCQHPENGTGHASLWEKGGPMVDLNALVAPGSDLTVTYAFFINDRGEIAAQGSLSNGDTHGVLLIPCDDDHPGVEGCDYSTVDADAAPFEQPQARGPFNAQRPDPNLVRVLRQQHRRFPLGTPLRPE